LEKQLEEAESDREKYEEVHATVSSRMVSLEEQLAQANQVAEAVKTAEVDFLLGRLEEKDQELCCERAAGTALELKRFDTKQALDSTLKELEEQQAQGWAVQAELDEVTAERDALAVCVETQKAEAEALSEALAKAERQGQAAEMLATARGEELRKLQKTLETVEAVAKGHEQDLLQEVNHEIHTLFSILTFLLHVLASSPCHYYFARLGGWRAS
jgi:chromosome segregation ATPase